MMFEEVEREFSFGSYILQVLVAYCGPVILFGIVEDRLGGQSAIRMQIFGSIYRRNELCSGSLGFLYGAHGLARGKVGVRDPGGA